MARMLILTLCTLALTHVSMAADPANRASGVGYIGKGYNIIDGNPDGVQLGGTPPATATDTGIIAHQLLKLTYETHRTDAEERYIIPDQLNYSPEDTCFNMTSNKVIFGQKSYQKKLMSSVDASAGFDAGLVKFAFSAGMGTKQETHTDLKTQKVYFDETVICTYGMAMYRFGNDPIYQKLSSDMKREICKLNEIRDDKYYEFFDEYGTHFIHGAILGSKLIRRKETTMTDFYEKVLDQKSFSGSASGSYMGKSGGMSIKVDSSSLGENTEKAFTGDELTWTVGSKSDNKPTKLYISSVAYLLDPYSDFWFDPCYDAEMDGIDQEFIQCCQKLPSIYENVQEALQDYPSYWRHAAQPEDPNMNFELVWPEGTYVLPRPSAGCANGTGFDWAYGMINQDTPDWRTDNKFAASLHWDTDQLDSSSIVQKFCVKGIANANDFELKWPKGAYCIQKYRVCPQGLEEGWLKWDDENTFNRNRHFGALPSGEFDTGKTKIEFCCRNDGSALTQIFLPNTKPFYLLRSGTECQMVNGMTVKTEYVQWSRERWWGLSDNEMVGGKVPYHMLKPGLRLYYCYYEPIVTGGRSRRR